MNTTTQKSTEIMSGSTTQKKIEKKIELKINKKLSNNMNTTSNENKICKGICKNGKPCKCKASDWTTGFTGYCGKHNWDEDGNPYPPIAEKKIELKINKKLSNNMNATTTQKIITYLKYKADMKTFKHEQDFVVDADATITGMEKMTLMYDKAPEKPTDEELEEYHKIKAYEAIERLEKMEAMMKQKEIEEFRMNNVAVPEKIIKVGYVCFGCKEVPKSGDCYGNIIIENDNGYFDRTEVVKRTKSFVWVKDHTGNISKKKVNIDGNGDEYIADEYTQPVEGWRGKLYTYFTEEGKWW